MVIKKLIDSFAFFRDVDLGSIFRDVSLAESAIVVDAHGGRWSKNANVNILHRTIE
jgi:hypothetical protein